MKMISLIGDKLKKRKTYDPSLKGFTFFEVMVTVAILSTGIVMIYKALLLSLDYQNHLVNRLYAMNLLNDRMAVIQEQYQRTGATPDGQNGEVHRAVLNNRLIAFQFFVHSGNINDLKDIVALDVIVTWSERGRKLHLNRTAYISRTES